MVTIQMLGCTAKMPLVNLYLSLVQSRNLRSKLQTFTWQAAYVRTKLPRHLPSCYISGQNGELFSNAIFSASLTSAGSEESAASKTK